MPDRTINDIPAAEAERIRQQVADQINRMDEADRRIQSQAFSSFAEFVAQLAYEIASLLGYAIAIPLAWAQNVVESVSAGLEDGFERGLREQRARIRRRR